MDARNKKLLKSSAVGLPLLFLSGAEGSPNHRIPQVGKALRDHRVQPVTGSPPWYRAPLSHSGDGHASLRPLKVSPPFPWTSSSSCPARSSCTARPARCPLWRGGVNGVAEGRVPAEPGPVSNTGPRGARGARAFPGAARGQRGRKRAGRALTCFRRGAGGGRGRD